MHVALLFNSPSHELDEFFKQLWNSYPKLRTSQYKHQYYRGENVLHIAIMKKCGLSMIKEMLESEGSLGQNLLEHQATGAFFSSQASATAIPCLGQYPLFFAACTLQIDVFKEIFNHPHCPCPTEKTTDGNNLVHLFVLNAVDRVPKSDSSSVTTRADNKKTVAMKYCDMFDILDKDSKLCSMSVILKQMLCEYNNAGYIPLTLAAAKGSLIFFEFLYKKQSKDVWNYGHLACSMLDLKHIDVPLLDDLSSINPDSSSSSDPDPNTSKIKNKKAVMDNRGFSVLEILVKHRRKDILTYAKVSRLVQLKWDKYGSSILGRKIVLAFLFTALLLLATVLQPQSPIMMQHERSLILFVASSLHLADTYYLVMMIGSGRPTLGFEFRFQWETFFFSIIPPFTAILAVASFFTVSNASNPVCTQVSQAITTTFMIAQLEQIAFLIVSILAFVHLLYLVIAWKGIGNLVLILSHIVMEDVPKFSVLYFIFLLM